MHGFKPADGDEVKQHLHGGSQDEESLDYDDNVPLTAQYAARNSLPPVAGSGAGYAGAGAGGAVPAPVPVGREGNLQHYTPPHSKESPHSRKNKATTCQRWGTDAS